MVALIVLSPDTAHRVLRGDQANSSDDYDFMSPKLSRRRERTFLQFQWDAKAWRTGVQVPALLLHRHRKYANQTDPSQNVAIIAMARIHGKRRETRAYETRSIEVSNWTLLPSPIPLHQVTDLMWKNSADNIWSLLDAPPQPLPERLYLDLRSALEQFIPDYDQILESKVQKIQSRRPDDIEIALRSAERRDRHLTAYRIFGETGSEDRAPTAIPEHAELLAYKLTEKAMLTDDSQRMPGWKPSGASRGGWFEFSNSERRLLIRDIDRERENESGSDLIYIRESPATIILVQYKRLTRKKDELSYRYPGRLHSQLSKIISFEEAPKTSPESGMSQDSYRLSEVSGFVKFVESQPLKSEADEPLRGYYCPARYYYNILDSRATAGELDSQAVFTPDRYIDTLTFTRLVSGGWIGTRSSASLELAEKLGALLRDTGSGETTIAVEVRDPA